VKSTSLLSTKGTLFQWLVLILAVALCIVSIRVMTSYIPFASDWEVYFQPTIQAWIDGGSALYGEANWSTGFWNPPWMVWLLLPLAVWPVWVGWGAVVVATFLAMAWLTKGYPKRWLVFTSPLIVDVVINGQVEIIPMLGIALGWMAGARSHLLGIGLVLMAAKPQATFLVGLWLWWRHPHRIRALLVPAAVFAVSLVIHGWDWPIRWASGPSIFNLMPLVNNSTAWRSVGFWMAPVALVLALWALRLPRTRINLGALVVINALITPYMNSHSLIQVLTFSLLPLGPAWAVGSWASTFSVFLRAWFGKPAVHLDFVVAAILTIGYLLHADHKVPPRARNEPIDAEAGL
jgi:hypothetical protein